MPLVYNIGQNNSSKTERPPDRTVRLDTHSTYEVV